MKESPIDVLTNQKGKGESPLWILFLMRNCCCTLLALILLLLFLLHLVTTTGSPSLTSFFRFLFNFLFIVWDVARNSSESRVGLLRPSGQGGFYSEEELLARNNNNLNNSLANNNNTLSLGVGEVDHDALLRYEELEETEFTDNQETTPTTSTPTGVINSPTRSKSINHPVEKVKEPQRNPGCGGRNCRW